MKVYDCLGCQRRIHEQHAVRRHEAKALGCVTGLAVGAGGTKNAWAALGAAVVGTVIGTIIDETIGPKCPLCGEALKLLVANAL